MITSLLLNINFIQLNIIIKKTSKKHSLFQPTTSNEECVTKKCKSYFTFKLKHPSLFKTRSTKLYITCVIFRAFLYELC